MRRLEPFGLWRAWLSAWLFGCLLIAASPAEGDDHWAFRPLARPEVPAVDGGTRLRTSIDAFILARLRERGLSSAPQADPSALVRRVYFDLLGLPPSPEEVDDFVNDSSEQAYERLLDRLLASPHYGERWGRHWLDNAGYADVYGGDNDAGTIKLGENKWRYRDYVVTSLNADKPLDRFLTEQLAGDELADWRAAESFTPEIEELLIATGFLRNSADDTNENELNTPDIRFGVLQRTIEGVAGNLLGLTLQCAKCHDHKYEPITQRDYYQWQAIFQPAFNPDHWLQPQQRQLAAMSPRERESLEKKNAEIERQIDELRGRIAGIREPIEQKLRGQRLAAIPEVIRSDVEAALNTEAEKRTEVQRFLAEKFQPQVQVKPEEVNAALGDADKAKVEAAEREIQQLTASMRSWQHWQVVYDAASPTPTRILSRGNYLTPGEEVPAGTIDVLGGPGNGGEFQPQPVAGSSGRRLALARWLTDTSSPAGAVVIRVRVNRIWQQLFGRGIVETADNLGVTGAAPTHEDLLEWLACEFVAGGQRQKPFLKRIMLSSVYRQASADAQSPGGQSRESAVADPENELLWKQRLRRLESEAVRDAMLAVSGRLDRTLGGAPIPVEPRPDGSFVVKEEGLPAATSPYRRSLYLLARRNYHPTLLAVFDQPHMTTICTHRASSAVVLQSLTMLNDQFVFQRAAEIAARLQQPEIPPDQRIERAFQLVLGRLPTESEARACRLAVASETALHQREDADCTPEQASQRALAGLCHTLLNTSEFLYIP